MLEGVTNTHQYEELIKVFLPRDQYEIVSENIKPGDTSSDELHRFVFDGDKDALKRDIYRSLELYTGKSPEWGILTGIRPVKLTGEIYDSCRDMNMTEEILRDKYLAHAHKRRLLLEILEYQRKIAEIPKKNSISIYIGIPFCPTRCLYCSFTSNQVEASEIERYMKALYKEIEYCGEMIRSGEYDIESIYIGGGTPTTLNEVQLEEFLMKINDCFNMDSLKEFTVEAGRPDTITIAKLEVMKSQGVDRISVNPQTMKDSTLEIIGRAHTTADTKAAFEMAENAHMDCINADLIAGLPGESFDDFKRSLHSVVGMGADNITLHTLAVKRSSGLKKIDESFNYKNEALCKKMLSYAQEYLRENGYRPYYLYRQKNTSGDTENLGFCRDDKLSVYNIRIMEEAQSILAIGAGGVSKVYFPEENRLERVANVSNYEIYIERIEEMIQRKEKDFWR